MDTEHPSGGAEDRRSVRKPRSDAQRNRERILQAAKAAFAESGAGASLDDIARQAGVGAGTLYRHFPSREALLAAVYRAEVEKLADAADRFTRELPPEEAIRAWLRLFIDYLAAKRIIAAALNGLLDSCPAHEECTARVREAAAKLYDRAIQAGQLRPDVNPTDHILAIVGVTFFGAGADWKESAARLVDVLLRGSRP